MKEYERIAWESLFTRKGYSVYRGSSAAASGLQTSTKGTNANIKNFVDLLLINCSMPNDAISSLLHTKLRPQESITLSTQSQTLRSSTPSTLSVPAAALTSKERLKEDEKCPRPLAPFSFSPLSCDQSSASILPLRPFKVCRFTAQSSKNFSWRIEVSLKQSSMHDMRK